MVTECCRDCREHNHYNRIARSFSRRDHCPDYGSPNNCDNSENYRKVYSKSPHPLANCNTSTGLARWGSCDSWCSWRWVYCNQEKVNTFFLNNLKNLKPPRSFPSTHSQSSQFRYPPSTVSSGESRYCSASPVVRAGKDFR